MPNRHDADDIKGKWLDPGIALFGAVIRLAIADALGYSQGCIHKKKERARNKKAAHKFLMTQCSSYIRKKYLYMKKNKQHIKYEYFENKT